MEAGKEKRAGARTERPVAAPASDRGRPGVAGACLVIWGLVLLPELGSAQQMDTTFGRAQDSNLVFVHPLLNYAFWPDWIRVWERHLAGGSSFRGSVGSVTHRRFLTDVRLRIDEGLGETRFRFYYDLSWLDGEHVDAERLQQLLGFEATVAGPLGLQALVNPTSPKQNVDMALGLVLADASRERYLRLALRWDDFLYGDKNEAGGVSSDEPFGTQWEGRWSGSRWEVFSEGRYQSASRRTFPDSSRSPVLAGTERRWNGSTTRVRWLARSTSYLELELVHYDFLDGETYRDDASSYRYSNEILEGVVRYVFPLGSRWRAWPTLALLTQRSDARGPEPYDFSRTDLMPALFARYAFSGSDAVSLGWMGSASDRLRTAADPSLHLDRRVWADKVELGWVHEFTPSARLLLSLSHEVTAGRFGGGNVRFLGVF